MAKNKKKKELPARKSTPSRHKHKNRTGNVATSAPFNIMPMNRKQQSRKDKTTFLRSQGVPKHSISKMLKSGKKLKVGNKVASTLKKHLPGFGRAKSGNGNSGGGGFGGNKGWRKAPLKLPEHIPKACNAPWYKKHGNQKSAMSKLEFYPNDNEFDIGEQNILPQSYYSMPKSSLSSFQDELECFIEYIRLTPREISARNSVVQDISQLSHNLWNENVEVMPFGSFATLDVCTFQSDVDLALWNVVPVDTCDVVEKKFAFGKQSGDAKKQSSLFKTMRALKSDKKMKRKNPFQANDIPVDSKKNRINEWKQILEEVDLANSFTSSPSSSALPDKKAAAKTNPVEASLKETKTSKDPEEFMFVIDREGIQELGASCDENSASSTTKKRLQDEVRKGLSKKERKQEEVIIIDDSDAIIIDDSDVSDDDQVDKMNSFHQRNYDAGRKKLNTSKLNDPDQVANRTRSHDVDKGFAIRDAALDDQSWSSGESTYDEDTGNGSSDDDGFELNISNHNDNGISSSKNKTFGPTGNTRTKVIKALSNMGNRLRRSSFVQRIEVRRKARVPIVVITTRFGFDTDVALAGHNGADTSHYVRKLVEKFDSFSSVVLFLKVLLQQADLDKPFTGGLGSYKLYVLVANHFNMHQRLNGGNSIVEMLISFFYRYSTSTKSSNHARTYLCNSYTISSEGGEADLSPVSVSQCTELFQLCFQRIMLHLAQNGNNEKSLVASLIDAMKVKRERTIVLNQTKSFIAAPSEAPSNHPGNDAIGINYLFTKQGVQDMSNSSKKPASTHKKKKINVAQSSKNTIRDQISGKKAKRSSRGALVPKRRIDIEMKLDGMDALIQRGAKRRKNKRKQNRDAALTEFVMKTIR